MQRRMLRYYHETSSLRSIPARWSKYTALFYAEVLWQEEVYRPEMGKQSSRCTSGLLRLPRKLSWSLEKTHYP